MDQPTATQIKTWKAKHKEIFEIEIEINDEGEKAKAYVKKPDLSTLGAAAKVGSADPIKGGLVVLQNCWLGGDERIRENAESKLAAIKAINELFKVRVAKVKKL